MASTKKPSSDDIELFRRSVGPIRQLGHDKIAPQVKRPPPRPRTRPREDIHAPLAGFSDALLENRVRADDSLFFARPGLQQRLLQRLRRGQLPIEAELDMHGMTIPVAQKEVAGFLSHCRDRRLRSVRIIHGKGYGSQDRPVLKNRLDHWLRQYHDVLAFCSTRPEQGGTGAVQVLLRTRR